MVQFNFQFKRKLSEINSKKIFNQKKTQDSIQKRIFNSKLFLANSIQFNNIFNSKLLLTNSMK